MYHEGQFILRMCGIETGLHGLQFDVSRYSAETLVSAQILIVSGIGGLHAGALLVARLKLTGTSGVVVLSRDPDRPMQARLVGWILCIVSIIPELMYLKALLALRATGTYGELYDRELATGINNWQSVIGLAIVPGSLFMLAGSKGSPLTLAFSVIFICVHVGGFALVGLRSEAVLPILAFTWVFHKAVRALPRLFLLVGALLAVIVLPLLGVLRFTSLDQLSVDEVTSRYLTIENPLVSFIDETGISAVTVADTVELVPRERTYELGLGYLNALVQPLHFLVPLDLTGGYGLPSIWLAEARYRTMYEHGAAMGYSVVAEAYLEFSWVGPFLVLCGIGAIVARLESWCSRPPDVLRIAAVGYLVSILPHLTRQSVGDFVSPIFRYAVLPYLAGLLILGWRHHRAGRTGLHGEAREGTTTLYVM
jgi:oligosaccharide repeat unit polymerase